MSQHPTRKYSSTKISLILFISTIIQILFSGISFNSAQAQSIKSTNEKIRHSGNNHMSFIIDDANSINKLKINSLGKEINLKTNQQILKSAKKDKIQIKTVSDIQNSLRDIEEKIGIKPAVVYTRFISENYIPGSSLVPQNDKDDVLNIIIFTAEGKPIHKQIKGATRAKINRVKKRFLRQVSRSRNGNNSKYLAPAKQLYEWLVKPYEAEMFSLGIDNLMFIMDPGLRDIPVAALHDGKQFVIEKYSLAFLPNLNILNTKYLGV